MKRVVAIISGIVLVILAIALLVLRNYWMHQEVSDLLQILRYGAFWACLTGGAWLIAWGSKGRKGSASKDS